MALFCKNKYLRNKYNKKDVNSVLLMLKRLNKTIVFYCLENRDLMAKILGPSFASILEKKGQSDAQSLVGEDLEVELFLLLQNMDKHLLNKCLKEIPE